jgi:L-lactate dehydrogenase complex protein LldG
LVPLATGHGGTVDGDARPGTFAATDVSRMVAAAGAIVSGAAQSSRDRVLQRIRKANLRAAVPEEPIPRSYDGGSSQTADKTLELFEKRLRDYDARVFPVLRGEVATKIAEILSAASRRRIAIPAGLPAEWQAAGVEWVIDRPRDDDAGDHELSFDALNSVDGVMTAATVGVAVSGSIVLQHGPAEGRRVLTLLPDYHLCVIEAAQVVETLPEAFARLDRTRPVTFFSGPSATADIEMTRVKGVHGPRFLDVLLVQF